MGGFILEEEGNATSFPVNAEQLYFLIANNYIKHPPLTEDEINDRNKSDSFSRCGQPVLGGSDPNDPWTNNRDLQCTRRLSGVVVSR